MSIIQDTSMVKEELAKLLEKTGAGDKKGKRK